MKRGDGLVVTAGLDGEEVYVSIDPAAGDDHTAAVIVRCLPGGGFEVFDKIVLEPGERIVGVGKP